MKTQVVIKNVRMIKLLLHKVMFHSDLEMDARYIPLFLMGDGNFNKVVVTSIAQWKIAHLFVKISVLVCKIMF